MIEFVIPCSGELCEARTLEDAREYFALFNYDFDMAAVTGYNHETMLYI